MLPTRVREVLEDLLSELPPRSASVTTLRDEEFIVIKVLPERASAAPIRVDVTEDGLDVYLLLGRSSHLEMDDRDASVPPGQVLDSLRDVLRAVLQGAFVETVWTRGDRVVRARGDLLVAGSPLRLNYFGSLLGVLLPGEKTLREYEPYGPGA